MSSKKIFHISDLHFGVAEQLKIWSSLATYIADAKPNLLIITGDILQTPEKSRFEEAKEKLDGLHCSYVVCAGNHDRHPHGNKVTAAMAAMMGEQHRNTVSAWFDAVFAANIVPLGQARHFALEDEKGGVSWKIALLSLDTSKEARYLAQGHVPAHQLELLAAAARQVEEDADLCIAIQHHHLLPIAALENYRQTAGQLIAPTVMLNAGMLLESFAANHVNLVLHGHEHKHFVAKHATVNAERREVVVIGAGSATGVVTARPCAIEQASFNVLEFKDDRSIWLHEHMNHYGAWKGVRGGATEIFSSGDLRKIHLDRTKAAAYVPTSRVVKRVGFSYGRDVAIREVRTQWAVDAGEFAHEIHNSTGYPECDGVEIEWDNGDRTDLGAEYRRVTGSEYGYFFKLDFQQAATKRLARRITIDTSWESGGLLTVEDLSIAERGRKGRDLGRYRKAGKEFVSFPVTDPLEALTIIVALPDGLAPEFGDLEVIVQRFGDSTDSTGSHVLTKPVGDLAEIRQPTPESAYGRRAVELAKGIFLLHIRYPLVSTEYGLTWKLPHVHLNQCRASMPGRRPDDDVLLVAFRNALPAQLTTSASFSLYLSSREPTGPAWVLHSRIAGDGTVLPRRLVLADPESIYVRCWWGMLGMALPPYEPERAAELLDEEDAVITVPLRLPGSDLADAPAAMVRIGYTRAPSIDDAAILAHWLEIAQIRLLNAYLSV